MAGIRLKEHDKDLPLTHLAFSLAAELRCPVAAADIVLIAEPASLGTHPSHWKAPVYLLGPSGPLALD